MFFPQGSCGGLRENPCDGVVRTLTVDGEARGRNGRTGGRESKARDERPTEWLHLELSRTGVGEKEEGLMERGPRQETLSTAKAVSFCLKGGCWW